MELKMLFDPWCFDFFITLTYYTVSSQYIWWNARQYYSSVVIFNGLNSDPVKNSRTFWLTRAHLQKDGGFAGVPHIGKGQVILFKK